MVFNIFLHPQFHQTEALMYMCIDMSRYLRFHAFVRNNEHEHTQTHTQPHTHTEQLQLLVKVTKALSVNLFSMIGPQGAI